MRTLPELLERAASTGSEDALGYLEPGGRTRAGSYGALLADAEALSGGLAGVDRPVVLVLPDPAELLPVFWACQLAGVAAAPLPGPPRGALAGLAREEVAAAPLVARGAGADSEELRRLAGACAALGEPLVVCTPELAEPLRALLGDRVRVPADLRGHAPARRTVAGDALAVVQFSSGSTRAPRGVALSHANLLANTEQLAQRLALTAEDVELGWLPLHHDMGLVGCHLTPLWAGCRQRRMPPALFLLRPSAWLDAATRERATALTATPSGLRLLLHRLRAPGAWELSAVRLLLVGAEPVPAALCRELLARLAPAGLTPAALRPAYGLAEASVGVSVADGLATAGDAVVLGAPLSGCSVRVVDAGPDPIGHLEVSGPNVTAGYFGEPARASGWWPTGDLGFLDEGRVVVTGRASNRLFSGGRTLYAEDLEAIARETVREAVVLALPAGDREELVLVVLGARADGSGEGQGRSLAAAAARRVQELAGVRLDAVFLVDALPRTTSGKIARARLRQALLAGAHPRLDVAGLLAPALPEPARDLELLVRATWARVLRRAPEQIALDDRFRSLGGTSIEALEVLAELEQALGRTLEHAILVQGDTVAAMARMLREERVAPASAGAAGEGAVAIVGLACRFPDAEDAAALWRNLEAGHVSVRPLGGGRHGAALAEPYACDPEALGLRPEEAAWMDPQQRLLLELASELLERHGHRPQCGVYVGASQQPYLAEVHAAGGHPSALTGNLLNMLAARVAHQLGLRGPALVVDTACSSSLVAVHLACEALRRGQAEVCLAGGVSLNLSGALWDSFGAAGALSPSGRSRPFAEGADGLVPGEGAALVLLRPLAAALRDGDEVLAVLRGSAVNNDGGSLGPMAPNPDGQAAVLAAAYADAGIPASTVSYVEAHGTGTRIGDPLEVRALATCFPAGGGACGLGSLKGNLGHLMAAAGIAGLVKVVLALTHRRLPRTPGCEPPDPRLGLERTRLRVQSETTPWVAEGPLRAGVSAFGFGGTNCHVVLEEGSRALAPPAHEGARPELLAVSAPSPAHLDVLLERLAVTRPPAAAAAHALSQRRARPVRAALVVAPGEDPGERLAALRAGTAGHRGSVSRPLRVAFLYPGQGSEPDLVARQLERTAELRDLGVEPAAVLGHSLGELAAASAAGAFAPERAITWSAARDQHIRSRCPPGAMLAIASGPEGTAALLPERDCWIAAWNGPTQTVASGTPSAIAELERRCAHAGLAAARVHAGFAFHTPLVAGAVDPGAPPGGPLTLPFASTVLGSVVRALPAGYWRDHPLHPVRFAEAFAALAALPVDAFLELGHGLAPLARRLLPAGDERPVLALGAGLLDALGALWCLGLEVRWSRLHPSPRTVLALPTTPMLRRTLRVGRLHHVPTWLPAPAPRGPPAGGSWLVRGTGPAAGALRDALNARGLDAGGGAQVVHVGDTGFDPSDADLAACVWWLTSETSADPERARHVAMARALAREGRTVRVIEHDGATPAQLLAELDDGAPALLRLRGGERLVPGFRALAAPPRFTLARGAVVLVLGAGGVAGTLAAELSRRGAGLRLELCSRSPPSPELLARLHALSASVTHSRVDLADAGAVLALVRGVRARHGRLDGVIHAAGAVHLGSAASLGVEQREAMLAPKLRGAEALATALAEGDVGFVLLVSSIAGSVPTHARGLAHYAAASAALDALATRERRAGRPWTSVATVLWQGVGMARAAAREAPSLPGELAAAACLDAIGGDHPHVLLALPEHLLAAEHPESRTRAPHIKDDGHDPGARADDARAAEHRSAPYIKDDAHDTVAGAHLARVGSPAHEGPAAGSQGAEALLRGRLAALMNVAPAAVDPDQSFLAMGLDSLAAVDAAKALEQELGVALSPSLLLEHDTLRKVLAAVASATQRPQLEPATPAAVLPAQQTFWANQRFYPEVPCYVFLRLDLRGPLDPAALDRALAEVTRRHAMLRTVFAGDGGTPVPRASTRERPRVEVHDDVATLEHALRNQVYDLAQGPLFRVALCRLGPGHHALLFNVHHIVADAWSAMLVCAELLELHTRIVAGEPAELPALASTFAECAGALVEADRASAETRRDYWSAELRGAPTLRLPYDGDGLDAGSCGVLQLGLDAAQTAALAACARGAGVSLAHLVLASYLVCLERWSRQDDLVVRVAHARRDARVPDLERVVGCFADSLPLRVRVRRGEPFADLARRVRDQATAARRHGAASSLELAGLGRTRAGAGPVGVTPAGFSFPSFPHRDRFGALEVERLHGASASGFTELGLIAWEHRGVLALSWNYRTARFRPATVERLAREHLEVLHAVAAGRSLAPPARTRAPLAPPRTIHGRFLAQAERTPERVAARLGAEAWTYAELAARSRAVAADLGQGHALVGVCARPSLEALSAVIGVMRAGAAYVPLDPDWPDARIAAVVRDARAGVVLATAEEAPRLGAIAPVRVLGGDAAGAAADPDDPSALAYVMYTSGSTGAPKGVAVRHEAVAWFHEWVHDAFEVGQDDRFVQTSSLAFGGSIRQMYSPLFAGASVHPAPAGLTRDPAALLAFLVGERITIWNSVPTLWSRLLDSVDALDAEGRAVALPDLRWLLVGGEHVPAALVRRWRERFGAHPRLANLYGSTETVVNATWHELDAALDEVPIGRARRGSDVRLQRDDGRPCADGETGELLVGGPSLADGYLHAPALTEAAFVNVSGQRFYRTGDLARRRADGALVYLGRKDDQVKVHGNRVELGEIEAVLAAHPAVKQVVVVQRDERLVACVVAAAPGLDETELRAHVAARLPSFMVPHALELHDALPLTSANKVDRRALARERPRERAVPAGSAETTLARLWAELLHRDSVGPDDDFFALGGDSILALDMLQRVRRTFGAAPRPAALYRARTPRALAALLASVPGPGPGPGAGGASDRYPLSPTQRGFVQASERGASSLWTAMLPVEGALEPRTLERALAHLVARHPMLRTAIRGANETHPSAHLALQLEDLRGLARRDDALRERFADEQRYQLDLAEPPLLRLRACRTGETRWTWLVSVHHAIGDAASVHLLARELLATYAAFAAGVEPSLPPLTASFADVVALQSRPGSEADRTYWRDRFATPWPRATLGALHPTHSRRAELTPAELASVRAHARAQGLSLHAVLLAAFARTLRALTGASELVIGTAQSGRDLPLPGVEQVFGCFVTGIPVRLGPDLAGAAAVHQAFATDWAHAALPVDALLREIPRHPGSPHPAGGQFFLSFLDVAALPPLPQAPLRIDWEAADFGFPVHTTGTELLLGVLAGQALRLDLHAACAPELAERVLAGVLEDLRAFAAEPTPRDNPGPRKSAANLDAALICYLPARADLARFRQGTPEQVLAALFPDGQPRLLERTHTRLGTSGAIFLPRFADALAAPGLVAETRRAVELACALGARSVSLAGLLPAHTRYGHALLENGADVPLTTGHAATVVAVVCTLAAALGALGRDLASETLAVLGAGSIGASALELWLATQTHPRAIVLCDTSAERLAQVRRRLRTRAAVELALAGPEVPPAVYGASVILGATSTPGVLAVERLRPGTLVVDDSFPPCFDALAAATRMRERGDVLLTGGGLLDCGALEVEPLAATPAIAQAVLRELPAFGLPGCRVESLLQAHHPELPRVRGLVEPEVAIIYWNASTMLKAAPLHLGNQRIGLELLAALAR